ncbi:MAG: biotin/lipoyl-binding protein [Clostridia bacterium]|nr:biotin/lipoyl-binding protein [Clostridia bacterium]
MPDLVSPMAGKVVEVEVKVGDQIELDQEVMVLESMKMDVPVYADVEGKVKEIKVKPGDQVNQGDTLAVLE